MKKFLLVIALLSGLNQVALANLITNGSFEDVTGGLESGANGLNFGFDDIWYFDDNNQLNSWAPHAANTADYYAEVRDNAHLNGQYGTAQDGTKFLELDTHNYTNTALNGGVTQTLTGLASSGTFDLSFWYSPRVQTPQGNMPSNTNDFDVLWNGVLVQSFTNLSNNTNDHVWVEFTDTLIGSASGINTLTFLAQGEPDFFGVSIDNVVLTGSVAAVPEPQAYVMLLAGLGLLGFYNRKNSN